MMRITGPNLLTIRVSVRRKRRIRTVGNHIMLQLTNGNIRLQVIKDQVGERIQLLSSVTSVMVWVIMQMIVQVLRRNATNLERQDISLWTVRVMS